MFYFLRRSRCIVICVYRSIVISVYVLIIGTETMTRVVNWSDRSSCVLFGDGAGVMLLQKDIKPGVENVVCQSGGQGVKAL